MTGQTIVLIVTAIFASTGFWAFLQSRFQFHDSNSKKDKERKEREEAMRKEQESLKKEQEEIKNQQKEILEQLELQSKMLRGLAYDRIISLSMPYLDRGYITTSEFENLSKYLFDPYKALGGDGIAEKIMTDVKGLPIHDD